MPTSYRVRDDDPIEGEVDGYLIARVGTRYRVYEDGSYYSSTSGGVIKRGPVMRDTDWTVISFKTIKQAEAWIRNGCLVSRE